MATGHGIPIRLVRRRFLHRVRLAAVLAGVAHVQRTAQGPEHLELVRRLDVRSTLAVPLVARGRTLGVVSLVATGAARLYTPEDIALATDALERALRHLVTNRH